MYIKMKGEMTPKKQKRTNHKSVPADEDMHQFYELFDMIDYPANTNDYNIICLKVKPKPVESTQSVVEPPKPLLYIYIYICIVLANPPTLEAIKEETEHESEEQARKEDGIDVIPVVENLHVLIKTSSSLTTIQELKLRTPSMTIPA